MKEKIQEVQNYFADKLARGLYKVKKISEYTIEVIVDRKYQFVLWIGNHEDGFETWHTSGNFMVVRFTKEQKKTGHKIATKHRKGWIDTEKREKELAQLKELQEKYPDAKI